MKNVLVRDVPDDVIAALEERAARLGLSRGEFIRRRLAQEAATGLAHVTIRHLADFADAFSDLDDPQVMKGAWE